MYELQQVTKLVWNSRIFGKNDVSPFNCLSYGSLGLLVANTYKKLGVTFKSNIVINHLLQIFNTLA